MFLRQFKYLLAVTDEGHFGRAAERCHVTQPSLSTGIKQLELELGVPIFLRGRGRRFHGLTAEGERIVKWVQRIIASCDAMKDEIAEMQSNLNGRLRLGAMPSMSPVLPLVLKMLRERFPGVKIDVQFIGDEAMRQGLAQFSLDAAITYLGQENLSLLDQLPIYTEKLSLLVPDTDEFRGRATISWLEAASLPLAMLRETMHERRCIDEAFDSIGCKPEPKVESESILHLMFQVQFTELCTIIPSHFTHMPGLHPGTIALDLVDPVVTQDVRLFWAEGEVMLPMARALVSIIKELNKTDELRQRLGEQVPGSRNLRQRRDLAGISGKQDERQLQGT